jgi:hypothetical protein
MRHDAQNFFKLSFLLIVVSAGIIGSILGKLCKDKFSILAGHDPENGEAKSVLSDDGESQDHAKPSWAAHILKKCAAT